MGKARPIEATVRARKTLAVACSCSLAALGAPADAQDATESRGTIRIEVTGSHISRSEVESALPVQVLTREDIERSGSVTVAELMSKVSANVLGLNDQLSINNFVNPGLYRASTCAASAPATRWCCSTAGGSRTTLSTARPST